MPRARHDIPNVSISGDREFQVSIASRSLDIHQGRKAIVLAREFGGTKNGESFWTLTAVRGISFGFKTYVEAVAFADAVKAEGLAAVKDITWMGRDPKGPPSVFLHPAPRKIPGPR